MRRVFFLSQICILKGAFVSDLILTYLQESILTLYTEEENHYLEMATMQQLCGIRVPAISYSIGISGKQTARRTSLTSMRKCMLLMTDSNGRAFVRPYTVRPSVAYPLDFAATSIPEGTSYHAQKELDDPFYRNIEVCKLNIHNISIYITILLPTFHLHKPRVEVLVLSFGTNDILNTDRYHHEESFVRRTAESITGLAYKARRKFPSAEVYYITSVCTTANIV